MARKPRHEDIRPSQPGSKLPKVGVPVVDHHKPPGMPGYADREGGPRVKAPLYHGDPERVPNMQPDKKRVLVPKRRRRPPPGYQNV